MPFTMHLHSCNLDTITETRFDKVTRMPQEMPVEQGLPPALKAAVHARMRASGGVGPDAFGCFSIYFVNGKQARVTMPHLLDAGRCTHATITADEPYWELMQLVHDIARIGNMLIQADGAPRPMVPTEQLRGRIFKRWPNVVVFPTAQRLWAIWAPPEPVEEPRADGDETASVPEETPPADAANPDLSSSDA